MIDPESAVNLITNASSTVETVTIAGFAVAGLWLVVSMIRKAIFMAGDPSASDFAEHNRNNPEIELDDLDDSQVWDDDSGKA